MNDFKINTLKEKIYGITQSLIHPTFYQAEGYVKRNKSYF